MTLKLREFHNGLRVLLNLDQIDLEKAGVIGRSDHEAWDRFRRDPFRWFIRASDGDADKLWALIETRQVKGAA